MNAFNASQLYHLELTDDEFKKLSSFIYDECGIKLPPVKKVMLQCRLQKRLKELQMSSFKEYCDFIFSKQGIDYELINMLDAVSTNKTDFFRESAHFDFISKTILPQFVARNGSKQFKAWSAGCSSGEEPYTLAIVLNEFMETVNPHFSYTIDATDLSTKILQIATNAVYTENRIECIPLNLKQKYILRSKDREHPTVKIAPNIRNRITFSRLNLMDNSYNTPNIYDLIMCRNVLIYFDHETQEKVIRRLYERLQPDGILMLGHSESILNMKVPLKQVQPTVYCKA